MMANRKRDPIARACAAAWAGNGHSIASDDWPGVVINGNGWRVILGRDASHYRLQRRASGAAKWVPVYGTQTPDFWSRQVAQVFPDLPEAVKLLPADPLDAVPPLAAKQAVIVSDQRRLRYWAAPDYSGVLAQNGNLRSVRDRTGRNYAVQWVAPSDYEAGKPLHWITQHKGPSWPPLVDLMAQKTGNPNEPRKDRAEIRAQLSALFEGCPDIAADGPWPVVKAPPASRRRNATKADAAANVSSDHKKVNAR